MKKRKMLSLFLVGCLAAGTLAGCGGKSNSGDSQSGSDQASSDFSKLKILGTEGWAPCNDWNEVEEYSAYQILKSKLDDAKLDIDWEVVAPEQYSVILQTRFASGKDLPDIAKAHTMDDAALMALAEQGLIIPINEIIDKYSQGPAKEAFDKKFPTMRPLTTAEDGNIYWFCNVSSKYYGDNTDPNGQLLHALPPRLGRQAGDCRTHQSGRVYPDAAGLPGKGRQWQRASRMRSCSSIPPLSAPASPSGLICPPI